MIKSTERFIQYLDVLQATTSYAETSRALKQSEDLIFKWLRASKKAKEAGENPSVFLFAYGEDDEVKYLHEHVKAAITTSIEEIESDRAWPCASWGLDGLKISGQDRLPIKPGL